MKKILHIAEPFATGVLSFLIDITKYQIEKYDVYIVWGMRPLTPKNVETLFDPRVHLIFCEEFKGAIGSVINPKAYLKIRKLYHQINPDIIHMHSSASGFIGRWSLPCKKIDAFYTPHGFSFLIKNGINIQQKIFWTIEKVSTWRKCLTVACSEGEYQEAKKLSKYCTFINNGINKIEIDKYYNKTKKISPTVCTSGRILSQKNPMLFNKIAQLLPNFNFIWIGDGELKALLTAPNIKVTGWVSRSEALRITSKSSFFLLPSLWEGLSISLLEAMYLKCICIVSNCVGNRNVIQTDVNGFRCNSATEYATVIADCLKQKIKYQSIIETAHQEVDNIYNTKNMSESYEKLYEHSNKKN